MEDATNLRPILGEGSDVSRWPPVVDSLVDGSRLSQSVSWNRVQVIRCELTCSGPSLFWLRGCAFREVRLIGDCGALEIRADNGLSTGRGLPNFPRFEEWQNSGAFVMDFTLCRRMGSPAILWCEPHQIRVIEGRHIVLRRPANLSAQQAIALVPRLVSVDCRVAVVELCGAGAGWCGNVAVFDSASIPQRRVGALELLRQDLALLDSSGFCST